MVLLQCVSALTALRQFERPDDGRAVARRAAVLDGHTNRTGAEALRRADDERVGREDREVAAVEREGVASLLLHPYAQELRVRVEPTRADDDVARRRVVDRTHARVGALRRRELTEVGDFRFACLRYAEHF